MRSATSSIPASRRSPLVAPSRLPKSSQVAQKGPDARRRPKVAREAYSLYVERAIEGANEADGPFSAACSLLEVLGQPLDVPAQMVPLGHEGPNELGRAPGAEVLDFPREDVPIARGLAQNRVQSPVSLLEGREKVGVELVDGPVARGHCRRGAFHDVCLLLQFFRHFSMSAAKEASSIPGA